jgi:hypothetical protein
MRQLLATIFIVAGATSAWALDGPTRVSEERPQVRARVYGTQPAAGPNDAVLTYDSGPTYFFPDATLQGSLWGVRYTPSQACSLMSVDVFGYQGSGQVTFHFYSDDSGAPGTEVAPSQSAILVGDLTKETVNLSAIDMGQSEFYIVMEVTNGPPPFPVTDADGGTGRSWFKVPGEPWEHVVDFDISMRAGVRYYGADASAPEIVHIPVTLGFSEDFSTSVRAGLNDISGISSAWVFYRTAGSDAFDSTRLQLQFDNEWNAELLTFSPGTQVEYFIRAYDASESQNLGTFPQGAPAALLSYRIHPGRQLSYDDGYPDMFFFIDTLWKGNSFAVRMSPQQYPAKVNLLRAFVSDTTLFEFEVYAATGDSLGASIAGPFNTKGSESFGWADFVIPSGNQPTIYSGDFYVMFRWKAATPADPAVGADSLATATGRSYSLDDVFGWYQFTQFDWMIRAAVSTPTGIVDLGGAELPEAYSLGQNIPNPFNPSTRIDFTLNAATHANLTVYNLLGQQVRTLVDEFLPAGQYRADFDARSNQGTSLPSGLYFYRLQGDGFSQTRKMVLMR